MIKTDRQYHVSRAKLQRFREALRAFDIRETQPSEMDQIRAAGFRTMVVQLERELSDYERLKEGRLPNISRRPFEDIPDVLVEQRIAAGLTQRELAERLGMKEQQIQRYEATDYNGASLARDMDVVEAMPEFRVSVVIEPSAGALAEQPIREGAQVVPAVHGKMPLAADAWVAARASQMPATASVTGQTGVITGQAGILRGEPISPGTTPGTGFLIYFGNQGRLHPDLAQRGIYFIDANAISAGPTLEEGESGVWACLPFDTVMQRRHTLIDACRVVGPSSTKPIRTSSLQRVNRQAQPA